MKKFRVLLIEDDDTQRELLSETIPFKSNLDITVTTAEDGLCGIQKSESESYDVVVTDYYMPNLDGLEFIKKFREHETNKKVPVIFVSGFFSELDTANNKQYFENVTFLQKPFSINDLIKKVDFYLLAKDLPA
ncbi:MAG: response regulator [Oligoflexales bacterium]